MQTLGTCLHHFCIWIGFGFGFGFGLKPRKVGTARVHVAQHAQVVDEGGIPGAGVVVAEQLRLVTAAGGQRVQFGERGVLDGGGGHGEHGDIHCVVCG